MQDSPLDVTLYLAAGWLFWEMIVGTTSVDGPKAVYVVIILWGFARTFCDVIPSA